MLFRHAALTRLEGSRITEEWETMPTEIYPALLGSGRVGMAIDATGMQGLGSCMRQYRDTFSLAHNPALIEDQLYLYRGDVVSGHLQLAEPRDSTIAMNLMPCGWVEYELIIDGTVHSPAHIAAWATEWRRSFDPLSGLLKTEFVISGLRVQWTAGAAVGAESVRFEVVFDSFDGRSHDVSLLVQFRHELRDGSPIAVQTGATTLQDKHGISRRWDVDSAGSSAPILKPVRLCSAILCSEPVAPASESSAIAVRRDWSGQACRCGFSVVCAVPESQTALDDMLAAESASLLNPSRQTHVESVAESWGRHFSSTGAIAIGDPVKEHLVHMARYTLRAGGPWSDGLPLGTLWNRAFSGCTFWDSFFAADGMLRHGHVESVRDFSDWLVRTLPAEGRPHYWMTYFDGTPSQTEDRAYQVSLAYAQIIIRLCEQTRSRDDVEHRGVPYLRALARFLLDQVIRRDPGSDDGWVLAGEVSGDVDGTIIEATAERGMLLWTVACLSRYADYCDLIGAHDETSRACREIDRWFRAHPISMREPGMWGLWYAYLTGEGPHMDGESWRSFAQEHVSSLGFAHYGMSPWMLHCEGMGLVSAGFSNAAAELMDNGEKPVVGLGYHYETPYELRSGGLAPYAPASGSFLSLIASFLVDGDQWSDQVTVAMNLPRTWSYRRLSWRHIGSLNGAWVSGSYEPSAATYTLECARPVRATLRVPARIVGSPLRIEVNGEPSSGAECEGEGIRIHLYEGRHTVTIGEDARSPAEVLLIEPFDHGAEIAALISADGTTVRWRRYLWHRHLSMSKVLRLSRVAVLHESYVALPPEAVGQLELAVRGGLRLVTIFHSGCLQCDTRMAELTGVRARLKSRLFDFSSTVRTYEVTAEGSVLLPGAPRRVTLPATDTFEADPADGVDVLYVDTTTGTAAVTRRRVGRGEVWWLSAGNKLMDHKENRWGDIHSQMATWGHDPAEVWPDRKWLRDPGWRALFTAIVDAAKSEDSR